MKTNQREIEKLFEMGLQELESNHISFAKKYLGNAAAQGHEYANKILMFLCCSKDKSFARDVILCAVGLV